MVYYNSEAHKSQDTCRDEVRSWPWCKDIRWDLGAYIWAQIKLYYKCVVLAIDFSSME